MKVAIIHYWFITRRGGEKVVESILKLYPQADIYTLFYDEKKYGNYLKPIVIILIFSNVFLLTFNFLRAQMLLVIMSYLFILTIFYSSNKLRTFL